MILVLATFLLLLLFSFWLLPKRGHKQGCYIFDAVCFIEDCSELLWISGNCGIVYRKTIATGSYVQLENVWF